MAASVPLDYLSEHHTEISTIENELMQHLISGLTALPNIEVIRPDVARVPTICINVMLLIVYSCFLIKVIYK